MSGVFGVSSRRCLQCCWCISAFAVAFFLPAELVDLSKSILAATFSASNFYFWEHTGYFDVHNPDPLLHTWSLAVEEQFYILFPIFLVLVRRFFAEGLRVSVVFLFAASLLSSVAVVFSSPVHRLFHAIHARMGTAAWDHAFTGDVSRDAIALVAQPGCAWWARHDRMRGSLLHERNALSRSERTAALPWCRAHRWGRGIRDQALSTHSCSGAHLCSSD